MNRRTRCAVWSLLALLAMMPYTTAGDGGGPLVLDEFTGGIDNATIGFVGQLWNGSLGVELPRGATVLDAGLTLEGLEGTVMPSVRMDFNNTAPGKSLWAMWNEGQGLHPPTVDPYNNQWNPATNQDHQAVAADDGTYWLTETSDNGKPPYAWPIQLYHFDPGVTGVQEVTVMWEGYSYCSLNSTPNDYHAELWLRDHQAADWEMVASTSWANGADVWLRHTFQVPSPLYSSNGSVDVAIVGIHSEWAGPMLPAFDYGHLYTDYIGLDANTTGASEFPRDVGLDLGGHAVAVPNGELAGELRLGDAHGLATALQAAIADAVVEPGNLTVAFNLSVGASSAGLLRVKDLRIEYEPPVNLAPEWRGPGSVQLTEDSPYTRVLDLDASFLDDHNTGMLVFEVVDQGSDPDISARVDDPAAGNATLELRPAPDLFGVRNVTVRATDRFGEHSDATIDVVVVQRPDRPVLADPGQLNALENTPFEHTLEAVDVDLPDDALTFSDDSPAFDIDPATGTIAWTPAPNQVGTHQVLVTVTDSYGLMDQRLITIVVANTNDPPRITSPLSHAAKQDEPDAYIARAEDPDVPYGDALTFSAFSEALDITIDPVTGVLAFTPGNDQVPAFAITLRVQDRLGVTDEVTLTVTVRNVNDPPSIAEAGPLVRDQFEHVSYRLEASDPDLGLDLPVREFLTFSGQGLVVLQPTERGWVNFTVDQSMVGEHSVIYTVRDSGGLVDIVTIRWVFRDVNEPPVFVPVPPARVDALEDTLLRLTFTVADPEGDAVIFSDETDLFEIDARNGTVEFTPLQRDVGTHTVTVVATDAWGVLSSFTFELVVANVNDAPVLTVLSPSEGKRFKAGQDVAFSVQASDEDGDDLTYLWKEGDTELGVDAFFSLRGLGSGTHTVKVVVSDGTAGTEATVTFVVAGQEDDGVDTGSLWMGVLLVVVLMTALAAILMLRSTRRERAKREATEAAGAYADVEPHANDADATGRPTDPSDPADPPRPPA